MRRFAQIKDGEWFQPQMRKHLMACCDCGLVHWMDFRVVKDNVQIKARRAPGHTRKRRKRK